MQISIVKHITPEITNAVVHLLPQLTGLTETPNEESLEKMLQSGATTLFVAKEDKKIIGMLSIVIYAIPSGRKVWIEDVVTDSEARGKGVAKELITSALDYARKQNITKVDLTSSNHRVDAHGLYTKVGFEKRETSVFRILLDD